MNPRTLKWLPAAILGVFVLVLGFANSPVQASTVTQEDDPPDEELIERGEYLVTLAGCVDCHTPRTEDDEMILDLALSGGRPFPVPGLGIILSRNITQDEETGIGLWTDDEIRNAIKTGITADGQHLIPIMPYPAYSGMAEADVDAIVAYLRTVEPIENEIERTQILPDEALPQIPYVEVDEAPDGSDPVARGQYLIDHVFVCIDCHTPRDPETDAFLNDEYLSGGTAFEGPWGTVYSANLTPHETGLGDWTEDQIKAAIQGGVRPDGRVLIFMPWFDVYTHMNQDDLDAIVSYLQEGVEPIENEIPAPSLVEAPEDGGDEGTEVEEEVDEEPAEVVDEGDDVRPNNTTLIVVGVVLLIVATGVGVAVGQRMGGKPSDS